LFSFEFLPADLGRSRPDPDGGGGLSGRRRFLGRLRLLQQSLTGLVLFLPGAEGFFEQGRMSDTEPNHLHTDFLFEKGNNSGPRRWMDISGYSIFAHEA
jgi:hypothetical protein